MAEKDKTEEMTRKVAKLRSDVDTLTKAYDKAKWEEAKVREEVKEKWGLGSPEEVREAAEEKEKWAEATEKGLEEQLAKIQEEFGELLGMAGGEGVGR